MTITILAQSGVSTQPSVLDWLLLPFLISLVASVLTVVGVWIKDLLILSRASRGFLGRWDKFIPDSEALKLDIRPVPLVRDPGGCVVMITRKSPGVLHLRAAHWVNGSELVWEGDAVVNRQQHNRALVPWEYTQSTLGPDAGVYDLFLHDNGTLFMYSAVPPLPGDAPKYVLRRAAGGPDQSSPVPPIASSRSVSSRHTAP